MDLKDNKEDKILVGRHLGDITDFQCCLSERRDGHNHGSIPIHGQRLMVWLDIQGFGKIMIGRLVISRFGEEICR